LHAVDCLDHVTHHLKTRSFMFNRAGGYRSEQKKSRNANEA
jgi:hypothetical protein